MNAVIVLMLLQGLLGAVDTFAHHELAAGLPGKPQARPELALHAARETVYGLVYLGLAWLAFQGVWALILAGIMAVEVVITLKDFLLEDRTRRLPPSERALHTLMAMVFGAVLAVLTPVLLAWGRLPTGLALQSHGPGSWAMSLMGVCVLVWAVRDTLAAHAKSPATMPPARPNGRTVLVTGATGFLGPALIDALLAGGWRVMALARDGLSARGRFGDRVLVLESLDHLPAETRIDALVNLAGAPVIGGLWTRRRRETLLGSRLAVTRALLALTERLERKPAVLISASATGYYGDRGEEGLSESSGPSRGFMSELCWRWEAEAVKASELNIRVCLLRLGMVFDWRGGPLPLMGLPFRFGLGMVMGSGRQWTPWIGRHDAIRIVLAALDDPRWRGPVNAVAPDLVTQQAFAKRLARWLNRPRFLAAPAFALRLPMGEMADLFLASQRVLPRRLGELGFVFEQPRLEDVFRSSDPVRLPRRLGDQPVAQAVDAGQLGAVGAPDQEVAHVGAELVGEQPHQAA
jgi:uncharacterized protein (TIGR01777 family)